MASMESCGLTYVVARPESTTLAHDSHSYWDGEGTRRFLLEWEEGAVFYDSLPLWLRGLDLGKRARYEVPLFPTQVRSRIGSPLLAPAEVEVLGAGKGRARDFQVRLRHAGGEDRFWFARESPHVMKRWEAADGRALVLRKTMRLAYWERTAAEDEALLR
jgi:hypothetical protein